MTTRPISITSNPKPTFPSIDAYICPFDTSAQIAHVIDDNTASARLIQCVGSNDFAEGSFLAELREWLTSPPLIVSPRSPVLVDSQEDGVEWLL